jgi:hypothetical protein
MKIEQFICHSPAKEYFNVSGDSLGMGTDRALYYATSIGRRRIYRSDYPLTQKGFKLFVFTDKGKAQNMCDKINEANNDNFTPVTWEG